MAGNFVFHFNHDRIILNLGILNLSICNLIYLEGFVVSDIKVLSLGFMLLMLLILVSILLLVLNELTLIVVMVDSGVNLDFFWLLQILNFGVLLNEPLVFSTFVKDLRSLCKLPLALQFF